MGLLKGMVLKGLYGFLFCCVLGFGFGLFYFVFFFFTESILS